MKTLGAVLLILFMNGCATVPERSTWETPQKTESQKLISDLNPLDHEVDEIVKGETPLTEDTDKELSEKIKPFADRIKSYASACKSDKESLDCKNAMRAADKLEAISKNFDEFVQRKRREDSAEGILDEACMKARELKKAQLIIAHEKEIGRETGAVNLATLHNAGNYLVQYKGEVINLAARYKKKTGKQINFGDCGKE